MDNVTGFILREEVEKLKKKGESWGLSNEEIDKAILRALGGKFRKFISLFGGHHVVISADL